MVGGVCGMKIEVQGVCSVLVDLISHPCLCKQCR